MMCAQRADRFAEFRSRLRETRKENEGLPRACLLVPDLRSITRGGGAARRVGHGFCFLEFVRTLRCRTGLARLVAGPGQSWPWTRPPLRPSPVTFTTAVQVV